MKEIVKEIVEEVEKGIKRLKDTNSHGSYYSGYCDLYYAVVEGLVEVCKNTFDSSSEDIDYICSPERVDLQYRVIDAYIEASKGFLNSVSRSREFIFMKLQQASDSMKLLADEREYEVLEFIEDEMLLNAYLNID